MRPIAIAIPGAGATALRSHLRPSASPEATAAAARGSGVPYGEVRNLALDLLAFRSRQLRANQWTMNGPVFHRRSCDRLIFLRFIGACRHRSNRGLLERFFRFDPLVGRVDRIIVHGVSRVCCADGACDGGQIDCVRKRRRVLLAATRRLSAFVRVLRVAGGAASLFDVLFNHGHDGMVGDAPLTRTVIVQYVTETQPALLHRSTPENTS
jgi:hypothetical protein